MTLAKRTMLVAVFGLVSMFTSTSTANAGSYYRINVRAYRHYMMARYPSWLRSTLDNHIFNQNGIFDQLAQLGLDQLHLRNSNAMNTPADTILVAQRVAQRDPDLAGAQNKIREMCLKRGITYQEIEKKSQPLQGVSPVNLDTDLVKFRTPIGITPADLTR